MGSDVKNSLYKFQNVINEEQMQPQEVQDQEHVTGLQQNADQMLQDNAVTFADMTKAMVHIEDMSYTFMDGKTEKVAQRETRANSSMSHVLDGLKLLNIALKEPVTPEDLKNEEKLKAAQGSFLTVCQACRTYLRRHKKNPWTAEGRARRQMIEDLLEQTTKESIEFYERVRSYREEGIPDGVSIATWNDVLLDVRTEQIDTKAKGTKVTMGGAGTSKVHIIETKDENGQTVKRFFKEDELGVTSDYRDAFKKEIDRCDVMSKDTKIDEDKRKEIEGLQNLLNMFFTAAKKLGAEARENAFQGKTGEDIYRSFKQEFIMSSTRLADQLDNLESDKSKANILKELKNSLWGIRQDFHLGGGAEHAHIKKGSNMTKRNAATSRLADMLGVSDLVVKSRMARVEIDGKKMHGVIMDEAKGDNMANIMDKSKSMHYTSDSYRRLISLQIFDTLCAQIDRHFNNLRGESKTISSKQTTVTDFKGIDNDLSFGALKFKDVCKTGTDSYFNMTKITDEKGNFALPAIEEEFARKILALEEEQIRFQMADLLDDDEMDALVDRIKGVQKLLTSAMEKDQKLLIGKDDKAGWEASQKEFKAKANSDTAAANRVVLFTYFGAKYVLK